MVELSDQQGSPPGQQRSRHDANRVSKVTTDGPAAVWGLFGVKEHTAQNHTQLKAIWKKDFG